MIRTRVSHPASVIILLMTAVFVCTSIFTAPEAFSQEKAAGHKKRILYVNSYHPGYTWSDQILEGLNSRLKPAFGERIDLQVEYLDGKRYSRQLEGALGDALLSLFKVKYADTRIDLLLVSDQDAYNFMRKVRNEVFPGVPLIFAGVEAPGKLASDTTGILASTDIRGNVDLILQVLPSVKRLFILSDDTVTGRINREVFQRVTADIASRVEFIFLGTKPDDAPETLIESVARLAPPSDAVFFLDYYSSPSGPVNPVVFIENMASASKVPIFSHVDLYINTGIVAGKMNSGLLQGQQMADTAIGILRGTSTAHQPLQQEVSVPTADFSVLSRFSIDAARFPENTRFLNKPINILSIYKWHVLGVLVFFLLLAALTVVLAFMLKRQKRTEQELRNSEENLRITLNSIGDAVIATDMQGVITRMNPVAERLTGWHLDEAADRKLDEAFTIVNANDRKPAQNPVAQVIATGKITGLANHAILLSKTGKEYRIADSAAPILADSGEIVGVILVFHDVTEELALQEQLAQSQKLDAIGQLASGVAHDFNNILSGMIGAAELLKVRIPAGDAASRNFISLILESSQRAAGLVRQLLTFSTKRQTVSAIIDIHGAIDDIIALLEKTVDKRISISRTFATCKASVVGDGSLIRSALINIGINGVHAMPEGGSLTYTTKEVQITNPFDETGEFELAPGRFLQIDVRDTGCGISPEHLKRVFEPFFTTKEPGKGTGLGLPVVYGTIRQHKGAIRITSQIGEGTCVTILLPLVEYSAPTRHTSQEPVRGSGTILLVDDEPMIRDTGSAILKSFGYQVLVAPNGLEAIRLYHENNERIDLVILDMIMPDMIGRDCFAELKKIRPDVKVLLASGFSREEDLREMKEQGLAGFISKPYQGVELSQKVAEFIRR